MSIQVTTSFVEQYKANVQLLSQQKGSRLRGSVRNESVTGKNAFFEQIGTVEARLRTTRHADTPQLDVPHARRRVSLSDYDWADLIDQEDKVRMLIDPTSSYAMSAAHAMGRAMDDALITAALGSADTGVSGGTSVALPASQKIAASAADLTVAKLRAAKKLLDAADVDPSIRRYIAVGASQLSNLLSDTNVTSSDFNTVKALVQGELDTFLGFKFIQTQRLTTDSNSDRQVIAWAEDGLLLGIGKDMKARISERDDKNYATQVFSSMTIGATRMEEVKVVEIACTEA